MKIALVILHADPARGGAERYTIDLAAALIARGHGVTLVATSFAASTPGERVALPADALSRRGRYLKFLAALDAHLDAKRYDVIHAMLPVRRCDVYHPHAGLAAEATASGHQKFDGVRRPLAAVANRLNRKRLAFTAVERKLLSGPRPPLVLCLSDYVKATVQRHYGLPPSNLVTLFNAVDLQRFAPGAATSFREQHGLAASDVVALIIAQDFGRKGLAEAIAALVDTDPALKLLVVGKQDTADYERLAREKGVADRVRFAGPTTDPLAFYRSADFFVLPTRHDPCSLVVLEALATGLPVISSAFNGACEIMRDGVHGFVLPDPRDVDALRQRYRQMMDPARRAAMSEACVALRPKLSQDRHVDALSATYERVARL